MNAPQRIRSAATERADYLGRAVRGAGGERDEVLLGAKTVIAAMAAWVMARYLLPPSVSTFAPFTALVSLQGTLLTDAGRLLADLRLGRQSLART
ncbi:hypothetical protein [Streptomyces erythrochromogenes]|uniref:hypothetical protein n=1 Tax=Streptomyces erythrochromogenes TaxID=285574 RepID=UPI0037F971C0